VAEQEVVMDNKAKRLLTRAQDAFKKTGHLIPAFLEAYERTESCQISADRAGVSAVMVSRWKKNESFMTLFTSAHLRAQNKNNDNLKTSALQRAINGTPHYLIRNGVIARDEQGNQIVAFRDFETQLTMFMLKNRLPDEFKDKFEHEISGQLIVTLASEFIAIVRRNASPEISSAIEKELETLSAKMNAT
jgi:hypothetical protein